MASTDIDIRFLTEPGPDQLRDIVFLYRQAGWWPATEEEDLKRLSCLVRQSHCFAVALAGERLVGMGRVISDGVSDAYLQDVTVAPDFRGQGIATRLVRAILDRLESDGLAWVGLIAERGSAPFYQRFGFREMANAQPMLRGG